MSTVQKPASSIIIEVCVDSVQSATNAIRAGADRLEVCGTLGLGGGTTPSIGLVKSIQKAVKNVQLMIMIRPRTGDFLYTLDEVDVILEDIDNFKECGVHGIVVGVLTRDGQVDTDCMKRIIHKATPLEICFHRAFDMTENAEIALRHIINIGGVSRILTSGQEKTAPEAISTLESLFKTAKALTGGSEQQITIMPGSGINAKTVLPLLSSLIPHGLHEMHLSGGEWLEGEMSFRRAGMGMGIGGNGEWGIWRTLEDNIRDVRRIVDAYNTQLDMNGPSYYSTN